MRRKITGFLIVFVGFGLFFSSGLSFYLIESLNQETDMIDKDPDETPHKEIPVPDKDKKDDDKIIKATLTINPHVLNCKSNGKWITVFIGLPENYNVEDIDLSTVKLNNGIFAEEKPSTINDFDNDNLLDLMVKFDRSSLIDLLESQELHEVVVSGSLNNQDEFEGICEIIYL
ncbi:MAG: hypothetical protein ACFE8G_15360 [Candidatus Hermodarchaeota archaeon]